MSSKKVVAPIKSTTQQFIEIEAIDNDVVLLRDKSCSLIIETTGVNFDLLSEEEQRSTILSFSSLLNSLLFPIQIAVLSRSTNLSLYLEYLDTMDKKNSNETVKQYMGSYKEFIKSIIKKNTVIEKKFYFIIPFSPFELGSILNKTVDSSYIITRAKASLYPKRDHVLRLIKKTGLGGKVMVSQDLIELFYNLYNPTTTGRQLDEIKNYTKLIITK